MVNFERKTNRPLPISTTPFEKTSDKTIQGVAYLGCALDAVVATAASNKTLHSVEGVGWVGHGLAARRASDKKGLVLRHCHHGGGRACALGVLADGQLLVGLGAWCGVSGEISLACVLTSSVPEYHEVFAINGVK